MSKITLRWALTADAPAIIDLLLLMHEEIGTFPLSHNKMVDHVYEILVKGRALLAFDGDSLQGSIGLIGGELWYSDMKIISDDWIFVHPAAPDRLSVFRKMVAEVKKYAQAVDMPLVLTLFSKKDSGRKAKLFARYGDEIMQGFQFSPVGGEFRVN